jgi:SAM-dependent methyltransferase
MRIFYHLGVAISSRIDKLFETTTKESGGRIYRHVLRLWSPFRRIFDPIRIRLRYKFGIRNPEDLKLHLGCGWKHFDGYVNVDLWITDATDLISNITKLPWPDNSVAVIESYHVIEHISHKKFEDTLAEWRRVLKPGGKLILECPHFDRAVREYFEGNEARLINVFGRQRFDGDAHLFGYNPQRLITILEQIGFTDISETKPESSQSIDEPSLRIECKKDQ